MKNKTYLRITNNSVQVSPKEKTSWKGKMSWRLNNLQMSCLEGYIISKDIKYLANLLNIPEEENEGKLLVIDLLWNFSKNKSLEFEIWRNKKQKKCFCGGYKIWKPLCSKCQVRKIKKRSRKR